MGADGLDGGSRIRRYAVDVSVRSRLATTRIKIEIVNDRDCAAVRDFTLQLPTGARVTSLAVDAQADAGGCRMDGEVRTVADALESFRDQSNAGRPAALLSARDSTSYPVRVSLPARGAASVEVVTEELLARSDHAIPFQIPLGPGLPLDSLSVDVAVSEPDTGVRAFAVGRLAAAASAAGGNLQVLRPGSLAATARFELANVTKGDLPNLVSASYDYDPEAMPAGGLVLGSGGCVSHLFNPSSLLAAAVPKNIVFVIDVSGSMMGQKLDDAKSAFQTIIGTLAEEDAFAIHTFSSKGTESSWGPSKATSFARSDASAFVRDLSANGGTNLHDAFVNGLEQVSMVTDLFRDGEPSVPIVMMLSDGQATEGQTDRNDIRNAIRALNEDVGAKIFSLAFGAGADLHLLLAIAIQNQGSAIPIYEGYGDSAEQIEAFYSSKLRRVLLSDLTIDIKSENTIESQTQTQFPVFADGSEVFVRAKPKKDEYFRGSLQVVASAIANTGPKQWVFDGMIDTHKALVAPHSHECVQSFAHQKIKELLKFREATSSLGSDVNEYSGIVLGHDTGITKERASPSDFHEDVKARATELALDASLVWPGLTAMVTMESDACAAIFPEGGMLCHEGDGDSSKWDDMKMEEANDESDTVANSSMKKGKDKLASAPAFPSSANLGNPTAIDASADSPAMIMSNSSASSNGSKAMNGTIFSSGVIVLLMLCRSY